jgi:drug/metabolite transporter (DMT)-like permease
LSHDNIFCCRVTAKEEHMTGDIVRLLITLVLGVYLIIQARAVRAQVNRSRAFGLAGLALLVFALYTGADMASGTQTGLTTALVVVGAVLLLGAVLSYLVALRRGEISPQRAQFRDTMNKEVKRRGNEANDQHTTPKK